MKRNRIINRPEKISEYKRHLEKLLKLSLSAATLFATGTLWLLFVHYLRQMLLTEQTLDDTAQMFINLLFVALLAFTVMLVWEKYNLRVFGNKQRRKFVPPVPDKVISQIYGVEEANLPLLRTAKSLTLQENKEHTCSSWYTDKGIRIQTGSFLPSANKTAK